MKKIAILIVGLGLLTSPMFGQAKFYTNGGKVLVTELNPGMSDVKVVLPVPAEFSNHDLIEVAIDYFADDKSRSTSFNYNKVYKIDYLKGKQTISLWIKSPGSKSGDFCLPNGCFEMDYPSTQKNRNYTAGTISVRFFGKDVSGYEWVKDKRVPTYKYSNPLSKHNIKMTYGPIIKTNQTEKGMFKGHKYFGKEAISTMVVEEGGEEMISVFSSKRKEGRDKALRFDNPIYFHIKDVTGLGVNDMTINMDYVKTGIILSLFHGANPGSSTYIKGIKGSYYSRYNNSAIYLPMIMVPEKTDKEIAAEKKAEKTKDMRAMFGKSYTAQSTLPKANRTSARNDKGQAYQAHVQKEGAALVWVPGVVGGVTVEMAKLKVYTESQFDRPDGYYVLKPGEEAKSKFLWYFIGEKNGKIFAGSIFRFDPQDSSAEEDEFVKKMMTTYEIK
jgi:hypothetical protein